MRKRIIGFLAIFALMIVGSVSFAPNTHAYLTNDCFSIQYNYQTTTPSGGGKVPVVNKQSEMLLSTDKICWNKDKKKLFVGKLPSGSSKASYPKIKVVDDTTIKVTYCKNGSILNCAASKDSFKLKYKSGSGIKGLGEGVVKKLPKPLEKGATMLALEDNNGQGRSAEDVRADDAAAAAQNGGDGYIEGIKDDCANAGGAQSLGWIVCPIMSFAGTATEKIYNQFVEPSLRVEPQLFTGENSNVLDGWKTFQGIANTIFVVLFLVVIISQLTGVGIDNYGIKKILPKLIVTAILINLSYFLCLLFVDFSNILGNGFQALFDQLGSGLDPTITVAESNLNQKSVLSTGGSLAALGVLGFLVTMSGTVWAGPEIALSLLLGAIGVLTSIFFLFVLLAARQAAVVVLVVVSPVAVVCYALPNTKALFDKWMNLFKGLLLVYPIAGLLVGGGNYVSALLLKAGMGDGFFTALVAMLTGILPIFFIPTVLKSAFAAMGTLGSRIASFGASMPGKAKGVVGNSEAFKATQERATRWRNRQQAGVNLDPNDNSLRGRLARMSRGGNRGMARARTRYRADEKAMAEQDRITSNEGWRAEMAGLEQDDRLQRSKNNVALLDNQYGNDTLDENIARANAFRDAGDMTNYSDMVKMIYNRHGKSAIGRIAGSMGDEKMNNDEGLRRNTSAALRQVMADNSAFSRDFQSKGGDAFDMVNNGGAQILSHYSAQFGAGDSSATNLEDIAGQSRGTLSRTVSNLTDEQLHGLLTSDNQTVQAKIQEDEGKRQIIEAEMSHRQHNENSENFVGPRLSDREASQRYRAENPATSRQDQLNNVNDQLERLNRNLEKHGNP